MDKLLKEVYARSDKCCKTCELYMEDDKGKKVCAGSNYGQHTEPSFLCGDWEPEINYYLNMCDSIAKSTHHEKHGV